MTHPWAPEREVAVAEATAAVASTGYSGPLESVVIATAGWDNTVVLVDDAWVFRFPRREIALPGIHREIAWLPTMASHLPVAIPVPAFTGTYGSPAWPFWGGRHLAGVELAQEADVDRVPIARTIGEFLRALHDLPAPDALPIDPMGRADSSARAPRAKDVLVELEELGLWEPDSAVLAVLASGAVLGPCVDGPVLSHGDLYSRHVLIANDRVTGIIDWGDLCAAPPAVDLSIAYSAFRGEARQALFDAYGPVDTETRLRSRTMGIFSAAAVAHYAHDMGDLTLLNEALAGLAGAGQD